MSEELSDVINEIENKVSTTTDVGRAMTEFFKDKIDAVRNHHDIDLRSRLIAKSIRGHSVINFLGNFQVKEARNQSLADGLQVLSISLKRHVLSHKGESRKEIIELFKAHQEANRQQNNFSLWSPQKMNNPLDSYEEINKKMAEALKNEFYTKKINKEIKKLNIIIFFANLTLLLLVMIAEAIFLGLFYYKGQHINIQNPLDCVIFMFYMICAVVVIYPLSKYAKLVYQ